MVYLRIDGRLEGEVSLYNAPSALHAALRQGVKL